MRQVRRLEAELVLEPGHDLLTAAAKRSDVAVQENGGGDEHGGRRHGGSSDEQLRVQRHGRTDKEHGGIKSGDSETSRGQMADRGRR